MGNKSRKYFDTLKELVSSVRPGELPIVESFLAQFHQKYGSYEPKTLQLFKLLRDHSQLGVEDTMSRTGMETENAFRVLTVRLKEKILECLLMDLNIHRKNAYSDYYIAKFDVRKEISQAQLLAGRGLSKEALKLYNRAILKAKKYELFDPLVETLYLKRFHIGLRFGKKEADTVEEEAAYYEKCRQKLNNARCQYNRFALKNEYQGQPEKYEIELKKVLDELENDYESTRSGLIGYYLHWLKVFYYEQYEDYESVHINCLKLLQLINNKEALKQSIMYGFAFGNLAHNALNMHDAEMTVECAVKAQRYFAKNTFNHLNAIEYEFQGHFYGGDNSKAGRVISKLLKLTDPKKEPFRHSRRLYLHANVLFLKEKYKETHEVLQQTKEIYKDKEGWNIGIRQLLIMNQIERGLLDAADIHIDNMQQHLHETMKMKPVSERNIIILQLLLYLVKEGFNFKKVLKEKREMVDLLRSDEKYKWKILGPELIVFHKWFEAKAKNKKYTDLIGKAAIRAATPS